MNQKKKSNSFSVKMGKKNEIHNIFSKMKRKNLSKTQKKNKKMKKKEKPNIH